MKEEIQGSKRIFEEADKLIREDLKSVRNYISEFKWNIE